MHTAIYKKKFLHHAARLRKSQRYNRLLLFFCSSVVLHLVGSQLSVKCHAYLYGSECSRISEECSISLNSVIFLIVDIKAITMKTMNGGKLINSTNHLCKRNICLNTYSIQKLSLSLLGGGEYLIYLYIYNVFSSSLLLPNIILSSNISSNNKAVEIYFWER